MTEAGYVWNSSNHTLEHYYEQPPDYEPSTYQTKEVLLEGLSDWRFSYWDGQTWQSSWSKIDQLPKTVKIDFRFGEDKKEQEFLVNIPIGP